MLFARVIDYCSYSVKLNIKLVVNSQATVFFFYLCILWLFKSESVDINTRV